MVPFASQSSYLLMALPQGAAAQDVCRRMAQKRILIRNCHNFYGLSEHYIRVALKDREANLRALDCLVEILNHAPNVD
jgi:threonine-phosphate decarboxylase